MTEAKQNVRKCRGYFSAFPRARSASSVFALYSSSNWAKHGWCKGDKMWQKRSLTPNLKSYINIISLNSHTLDQPAFLQNTWCKALRCFLGTNGAFEWSIPLQLVQTPVGRFVGFSPSLQKSHAFCQFQFCWSLPNSLANAIHVDSIPTHPRRTPNQNSPAREGPLARAGALLARPCAHCHPA